MERDSLKNFWNKKILQWEKNRYGEWCKDNSLIESLARRGSDSLRFRMTMVSNMLKENVSGKKVVELGCGSGLLAEGILKAGAVSYLGIDIASAAIAEAKQRHEKVGMGDRVQFITADISTLSLIEADLIFSLGLFDWLNDEQIKSVFTMCPTSDFLHSFAEKKNTLAQLLHRLYVHISYGHRTGSYRPRYFKTSELIKLAEPYCNVPVDIIRHKRLSFGAIITTLA